MTLALPKRKRTGYEDLILDVPVEEFDTNEKTSLGDAVHAAHMEDAQVYRDSHPGWLED